MRARSEFAGVVEEVAPGVSHLRLRRVLLLREGSDGVL